VQLDYSENNIFRDFLINATTPRDIYFVGGNNLNNKFINFKYDPAKVEFDNDHDEFTPYYYLDVLVKDMNGNPVPNATVTITNEVNPSYTSINRKGEPKTTFTTGSNGHIAIPEKPNPVERYSDYFELEPNTDYSFGGWIKLDKGSSTFVHAFMILYEYDTDKNLLAARVVPAWEDTDWIEKSYNFTTKSDTVYGRVKLDTYSKGGSVWFDDLYVRKASTGENILPNPGFESGSSTPSNWSATDNYRGFWSSDAHSGSKSYKLVWNFDWSNDEDVACICDYAQTNTTTNDFTYSITAEKNGVSANVTGIDPNGTWYRSDTGVPANTVIITLPLTLEMGTLTGKVTDTTGTPIEGAIVTANGYSNITNSTGGYIITLPTGNYTLTASKTGYYPNSTTVQVLENQTTIVNFQLTEINGYTITLSQGYNMLAWTSTTPTNSSNLCNEVPNCTYVYKKNPDGSWTAKQCDYPGGEFTVSRGFGFLAYVTEACEWTRDE